MDADQGGCVRILPDALANQIAAGEVVERPASVVKELVENAIDAEASRVIVEVADGGRDLVRVIDDGVGMTPADAVLALKRHATSKLRVVEDLEAIDTLGFRGEALPSIASVSRFRVVTRRDDALAATEVVVEGGGAPRVAEIAGPVGTAIEVRDLFFNVPARLKFLKTRATEITHVKGLVVAFALGHPHIHLRLVHDGRTLHDYPAARRLDQRVFQVLGKSVAARLHDVRLDGPIRILGQISDPAYARTNQQAIHTFVNGRAVRDRTVTHALLAAYGALLERGRFPAAVLYVHLDPTLVDVNVHPTKAEVRFAQRGRVHEAIVHACRRTLADRPWAHRRGPRAAAGPKAQGRLAEIAEPARRYGADSPADTPTTPMRPASVSRPSRSAPSRPRPAEDRPRRQALRFVDGPTATGEFAPTAGRPATADDAPPSGPPELCARLPGAATSGFGGLRVVGQLAARWILAERPGEGRLVMIDQAAASEALLAKELRETTAGGEPLPTQPLLFPAQLELTPDDAAGAARHHDALTSLGLALEPFGGATHQLSGVPLALAHACPESLARAALGALRAGADPIAALARHAPIRAGRALDLDAARGLVADLAKAALPFSATASPGRVAASTSAQTLAAHLGLGQ